MGLIRDLTFTEMSYLFLQKNILWTTNDHIWRWNSNQDFVNAKDVARANYLASLGQQTDVYNLGSGSSITINRLAEMMQEITGINVGVEYAPERPADVKHCKANAYKAKKCLNFEAEVELYNGLVSYLEWYKNNCLGE